MSTPFLILTMRFTFFVVFTFLTISSFAQDQNGINNLIKNLSEYRLELLAQVQKDSFEFRKILDQWKELEPDEDKLTSLLNNIVFAKKIYGMKFKRIKKLAKKDQPKSQIPLQFTEQQLEKLSEHANLVFLISHEILDIKYPYKIKKEDGFIQELAFYDISDNEAIGEVGAGNGTISLLISFLDKKIEFYINELDDDLLDHIKLQFQSRNLWKNMKEVQIIEGHSKRTNFKKPLDRIIIRNTLHHFSKMDKMLESIHSSLKTDGTLFIKEYPVEKLESNNCKKRMSEQEYTDILQAKYFDIVDQTWIGNGHLLKLKPRILN